ncbi:MAG: hypothetical protein ACTS6J_21255 [Burkholderiales bacterium]
MRALVATIGKGLCFGLLAAGCLPYQAAVAEEPALLSKPIRPSSAGEGSAQAVATASFTIAAQAIAAQRPMRANFERERASRAARQVADWVVDSGDNRRLPFAIVDKTDAKVFVFDAHGRLRGAAAALLGLARGDDTVPGIGERPLSSIRPEERTTPAGRFVAALGMNAHGKDVLWVDYDGAVSMHRVLTTKPKERRLQRLATATPLDNRISYGCINVPVKFYENVVRPAFTGTDGIVYVLPETRSAREAFASYDVDEEHARLQSAHQAVPAQAATAGARL